MVSKKFILIGMFILMASLWLTACSAGSAARTKPYRGFIYART